LRQLQDGQPLRSDPDATINLIHVEDAAEAVLRVAVLPLELPRTFVIADGHPVARREFYDELSRQVHAPPPHFQSDPSNLQVTDRSSSFKRVSNKRMLTELGLTLRFPTYREGLAAIATASRG
jgi:nucleoside-diphosphate-sugar epimerase